MSHLNPPNVIGDVVMDASRTPTSASRERAQWMLLSKNGPFPTAVDRCDIWPGNTRDVGSLGSESFVDLMQSLRSVGQKVPVIGRVSPANPSRLEVIAGACRLTAIKRINEELPQEEQMPVIVDLRDLDNESALTIVDAENRGRSEMSPLEKARFYDGAIPGIYANQSDLADALGLDKSTVTRQLAIVKLPASLLSIIKDHHQISAAQASGFMTDWKKPELTDALSAAIDDLAANAPHTAAIVFKALKAAVAPPSPADTIAIIHDDGEIGSVRQNKSGSVIIEIAAEARALGWDLVAKATGAALRRLPKPRER